MKALAAGKKQAAHKAIICLLECTLGTQFESYLDDEFIRDIADVVNFDFDFEEAEKARKDLETQKTEEKKEDFASRAEQRAAQGSKVCLVEDDLEMTEEELEILRQRQEDKEKEEQERKEQRKQKGKKSPTKK